MTKTQAQRALAIAQQKIELSANDPAALAEANLLKRDALAVIAQCDKRNKARRDRDSIMRDMGLVKVKGNLGGTYWE